MQIAIRVHSDAARALRGRKAGTPGTRKLLKKAGELGVALEPMHPRVADPQLASYFVVQVPDQVTAERVMQDLRECEVVEAAYLKPPDALP